MAPNTSPILSRVIMERVVGDELQFRLKVAYHRLLQSPVKDDVVTEKLQVTVPLKDRDS